MCVFACVGDLKLCVSFVMDYSKNAGSLCLNGKCSQRLKKQKRPLIYRTFFFLKKYMGSGLFWEYSLSNLNDYIVAMKNYIRSFQS